MFDPQQALLNLLQPGGANQTLFPPSSRYYGIPTATFIGPDGAEQVYLRRRFLPPLGGPPAALHVVKQMERLDHIAFAYLSDPEQFWRIADLNTEMDPLRLVEPSGRRLSIPAPGPA